MVGVLLPALTATLVYSLAWRSDRLREGASKRQTRVDISKATLVFATALICFAVVPMVAWQSYFRGELNGGLDRYLSGKYDAHIERKDAAYMSYAESLKYPKKSMSRCEFAREHVLNFSDDDGARVSVDGDGNERDSDRCAFLKEGADDAEDGLPDWPFAWLEPMLAHSEISKAMMRMGGHPEKERDSFGLDANVRMSLAVLVLIVGAVLLLFLSYSSVRSRLGHARMIASLPRHKLETDLRDYGTGGQIRLLLVTRSKTELGEFLDHLKEEYSVFVASWNVLPYRRRDVGRLRSECGVRCRVDGINQKFRDPTVVRGSHQRVEFRGLGR